MSAKERERLKRIREYVIERDGKICCYCEKPLEEDQITMEHIVPFSKKGTFNSTNLTVSCAKCNNKRGNSPFFDYCKDYNFSEFKMHKYKLMYFNNLKIKVLNIAKEECLKDDIVVPLDLISQACNILKIKPVDFSLYEKENNFEIKFGEATERKKIKYCFEQLIRIIETETYLESK